MNDKTRAAMQQALEYLRDNQHYIADNERHAYVMEYNAFVERLEALADHVPDATKMIEQPAQQHDYWQEEARRYAQNADFWRGKYEAATAQQQEQDRQIDQLIQERDHRDEIIDKLCDAVLGPDRYEWSSQYFFEDAVREVEERMAALEQPAQQEPVAWMNKEHNTITWDRLYVDMEPLYLATPQALGFG